MRRSRTVAGLASLAVVMTMAAVPALAAPGVAQGPATGLTGWTGPMFERNVSGTPDLATSKAKIDSFAFYVPARNASGEAVPIDYLDAHGRVVETRNEAKPLLSVYVDDDADPLLGDDVWAAYSLDDGDTWKRTNLSLAGDRSSYEIGGQPYPGMTSKPALTMKGNRALVSWTSSFCGSGFPAYADSTDPDPYSVAAQQRSVDYTEQGYPEVGEVPYKCLWAARGRVDQATGAITWFQPERLTSGARYAMQMMSNSAPNAGFVIGWAEDPDGLNPGEGSGPGGGWSGANPHPGTDVWYSYLPMSAFDAVSAAPRTDPSDPAALTQRPQPANRFSIPVPVSDNGQLSPLDPLPTVGATRPAVGISPYSFAKPEGGTGTSAWVAYGYEETKGGVEETEDAEAGKQVFHHAFRFDSPEVFSPGTLASDPAQSARRVRYITQPVAQMGASRTIGLLLYRMGPDTHAGAADFIVRRFVVPAGDSATDNPFRSDNMTGSTNVSATTELQRVADPVTGEPRVTRWIQTPANLSDGPGASALESARGHRGMMKGDFLALGYLWTPNWDLYLQGRDVENYYVRRSFDGGATFTTAPSQAPYHGEGVTSCRYFTEPLTGALLTPVCAAVGPGEFEPAQNLTRLDGLDTTAIEPRLPGLPGSIPASAGSGTEPGVPYPEDVQDTSVVWQAWGTGSPQLGVDDDAEPGDSADVPIPDSDPGKGPLDVHYTFSQDYGDTYVASDVLASGPSAQGEVQMRFSPDGSRMGAVWNDLGPAGAGDLDVFFRRVLPDAFEYNTTPGDLGFAAASVAVEEGQQITIPVERVVGWRGDVTVDYATADGSALAGTDYEPVHGTLQFAHGVHAPQEVTVQTVDDAIEGADTTFSVALSGASAGARLGDPTSITVTIRDNDDTTSPWSQATSPSWSKRSRIPVTYTVADARSDVVKVELFVRGPGEATYQQAAVDTTVDGTFSYDARRDGRYRFYTVATDGQGNVEPPAGSYDTRTIVDTRDPRIGSTGMTPRSFDISRQHWVRLAFRLGEPATTKVAIRHGGRLVRRLPTLVSSAGQVHRHWNGRNADGKVVHNGTYRVVFRAVDEAGNKTVVRLFLRVTR